MENLLQDLRYGFRMLWKSPGFTLIAVLALALGIGANTAIFSVVNGVLLQPLPFQDSDRLVRLSEWSQQIPGMSISYPNLRDWQDQNTVFTGIAGTRFNSYNMTGTDEPERLQGRALTGNFFDVLGIKMGMGRTFTAEDDKPGAQRTCIISYGLWQRRFGSDPNITGKTLILNDQPHTVIGVLPASYRYGTPTDVFVPLGLDANNEMIANRDNHPGLYAVARLKPNVSFEQAEAEMKTIAQRLSIQYPKENTGHSATLIPLREFFVGDIRTSLLILLGAVGFVLLIACANVANLLLARASSRSREIAIRTALGAGRWRIIRQLLTESVILAIFGGGAGLLLALWGIDVLRSASIDSIPTTADIKLDGTVLFFTLLVSVLTGVIFGLAPALQASRTDLNESLKEGGRSGTTGTARQRVRNSLVIFEVALSLVLLVGAGLLVKSFVRLRQTEVGFDTNNLLTMQLSIKAEKGEDQKVLSFFQRVEQRVKNLPGVQSVSFSNGVPFIGASEGGFTVEGRPDPEPGKVPMSVYYITSPSYLQTTGIRLLKGRFFTEQDTQNSPLVVVIDEAFAREQFPNEDPIGKYLAGSKEEGIPHMEIVGVVSHVKNYGLDSPGPVQAERYYCLAQTPARFVPFISTGMTLIVRAGGDPTNLIGAIRHEVQEEDKNQPVYGVKTMEQVISESIASQKLSMTLLGLFAVVALVLAVVGIYGVMSYMVAQRTHEIGIRMALGARVADVFKLVVGHGMTLVLVGVGIGLVGAFALTRVMATLLFGVSATDPWTFAGVSLALAAIAFVACLIPARKATKVDPMIALRYE
ncbi:MAG: ABC transporter permease [Pyrinomonadaceae bacterium]